MIDFHDFEKLDIRLGEITEVAHLENAKYSTHKLVVNFGDEVGFKQTCARVVNYSDEDLLGKKVVGLVNIPPRQIGKNMSEFLVLGVPDAEGEAVLLSPDMDAPLGGKLY